ncbi:MAG: AAA family ATPase [Burkholderiales bacterium]|nr:AAA family ATPase [Burkholderiales bacterium]
MSAPVLARFGPFHLDEANAQLQRAGRPVDLQPKELAVLCELARRPGRLVTKDELLDAVWGHLHVSESVLKTIVSHLRAALDDDARAPRWIETVSRRGYRFVAALQGAAGMEAAPAAAGAAPPQGTPMAPAPSAPLVLPVPPVPPVLPVLVGRDAPLARLHGALHVAQARRRQLMLLAGEAGIGKTTLIDAFAGAAADAGAMVARGQCVEHYGVGEPYMPVLEAVDMLARAEPGWLALLRRVAPSWLVQMPWHLGGDERRELQREVAGLTQERMLREMGELLDRGSEQRPLVLVLEDLHWSDHATVRLIGYLARRRSPAALLLLASLRPAEVIAESHPLSGLRQELRVQRLCDEIDLEAFSEAEVGVLLQRRLAAASPGSVPESFVMALHQHTGGLPLFVVNMVEEWMGSAMLAPAAREPAVGGADVAPGGTAGVQPGWRFPEAASLAVPSRIADVLEMRFMRLDADMQRSLAVASVAGADFLHLPLAEALQVDADALQRLLDAEVARGAWLRDAGVLTLPGARVAARYAFRHGLYRHVLYQRLSAAERVRWHRALGHALQRLHGAGADEIAGELALHFGRGQLPLAAMRQFVGVARRALGRGAVPEALRAVQQGLALLPAATASAAGGAEAAQALETELDLRVLEGVALTRQHVLVAPEVALAFERTLALCARAPASPARSRAQHGLWWVSFGRGDLREAERLARRLLDDAAASGEASLRLVGASTMGLTLAISGDPVGAREHLERALVLGDALADVLPPGMFIQDPGVEARAHLGVVLWWLGEPAAARRHSADAVARAFAIHHRISCVMALHMAAALHSFSGEMAQARQCTGRLFEVIREHGLPAMPGMFSWLHGRAMAATGEVDEGLALMRTAEASCRAIGMLVGITGYHYHQAEACIAAGRTDEALAAAAQGLRVALDGPEQYALSPLHRVHAELLLARGERAPAAEALAAALQVATRQQVRFHELAALTSGLRAGLLPAPAARAARTRLRELLGAYEDEQIPLVREARTLLSA